MEQEAVSSFTEALNDLDSIHKHVINSLTMMAEDYKDLAIAVVSCIEKRLKDAPINKKLPILYLIDSICKSSRDSPYKELFRQSIVSNFCNVFEASNDKVRKSLYKLRDTWEQNNIFPIQKLHAIDRRIKEDIQKDGTGLNGMGALEGMSNPSKRKKLKPDNQQPTNQILAPINAPPQMQQPPHVHGLLPIDQNMNANPFGINPEFLSQPLIPVVTRMDQQQQMILQGLHQPITGLEYMNQPLQMMTNNHPHLQPPPPTNHLPPIVQPTIDYSTVNQRQVAQPIIDQQIVSSPSLLSLYGGKQCTNCSLRFDDNNRYASHLDWHFRQNSKSDKKLARRKWYYPLDLWVQFREIHDDDDSPEDDNTQFDSSARVPLVSSVIQDIPTATASKDDAKNMCSVCHENFDKFWDEEEEEWRLKNAQLHEDGNVYHPLCLIDRSKLN